MKFYIDDKQYFKQNLISSFQATIGIIIMLPLISPKSGKWLLSFLLFSSVLLISFICYFFTKKRIREKPLIELREKVLIFNPLNKPEKIIPFESIVHLKKSFWLGWRIVEFEGNSQLPLRYLKKPDRDKLLDQLSQHILIKT